jgi:hypothetical protein
MTGVISDIARLSWLKGPQRAAAAARRAAI